MGPDAMIVSFLILSFKPALLSPPSSCLISARASGFLLLLLSVRNSLSEKSWRMVFTAHAKVGQRETETHKGPWHSEKLNQWRLAPTSFSTGLKAKRKWQSVRLTHHDSMSCVTTSSKEFSRKEYTGWVYPLLQGLPDSGLSLSLLHCRWIAYHLSHQESSNQVVLVSRTFLDLEILVVMPVPALSITKRG